MLRRMERIFSPLDDSQGLILDYIWPHYIIQMNYNLIAVSEYE